MSSMKTASDGQKKGKGRTNQRKNEHAFLNELLLKFAATPCRLFQARFHLCLMPLATNRLQNVWKRKRSLHFPILKPNIIAQKKGAVINNRLAYWTDSWIRNDGFLKDLCIWLCVEERKKKWGWGVQAVYAPLAKDSFALLFVCLLSCRLACLVSLSTTRWH